MSLDQIPRYCRVVKRQHGPHWPQTKEIANCAASYRQFLDGGFRSQEDCVADYQSKGYERIFLPGG